jgi:uncharacterized protein YndB with AHSA1/START domain
MATEHISASRVIDADAQELFDLVADPSMHAVFDGSGSVRSVRGGSRKLGPGDRFTTNMRIGVPYLISNKVVEYEEGRRIAWAHIGGWRWRYEFEPVDGGTLVTETFGGRLALETAPGEGARFVATLPWRDSTLRRTEVDAP